jgi:hypothetical protein
VGLEARDSKYMGELQARAGALEEAASFVRSRIEA